jgi:hypothetical protein
MYVSFVRTGLQLCFLQVSFHVGSQKSNRFPNNNPRIDQTNNINININIKINMTISMKFVVVLVLAIAVAANGKKASRPTRGLIEKTVEKKVRMGGR